MRRLVIFCLGFLIVVLGVAFLILPPLEVTFSQEQSQKLIDANLPYETPGGNVTVTAGTIEFKKNNKAFIDTEFAAKGLTLEGHGTAEIETGIRYSGGKFYLSNLRNENIQFDLSDNSTDTVSDLKTTFKNILKRETEEAIGSEDPDRIEAVQRLNDYVATQMKADALKTLDDVLGSLAIYNLHGQNSKFTLAALALESVTISEGRATAILTFQTFLIRVLAIVIGSLLLVVNDFPRLAVWLWRCLWGDTSDHKR